MRSSSRIGIRAAVFTVALSALMPTVARADTWALMPSAPIEGRGFASATWTGREMIVWGGAAAGELFADGATFAPAERRWRAIAPSPLAGRTGHAAVWTGDRLLVWGGCCDEDSKEFDDGASYDPEADAWSLLPVAPLRARVGHTAVIAGGRMLVWGGGAFRQEFADGAMFDPGTNTWQMLPGAPIDGRTGHTMVWTGEEAIIWGGTLGEDPLADGGALDPARGAWRVLSRVGLHARAEHRATWAGGRMVVSGGCCADDGEPFADAASYDPSADSWSATHRGIARAEHLATSMSPVSDATLLWGGRGRGEDRPRAPELVIGDERIAGDPSPLQGRSGAAAVWTGTAFLVWGGCCRAGGLAFGDGATFDASGLLPKAAPVLSAEALPSRSASLPTRDRSEIGPLPWLVAGALLAGAAGVLLRRRVRRRA